jgi:hypothetical protein
LAKSICSFEVLDLLLGIFSAHDLISVGVATELVDDLLVLNGRFQAFQGYTVRVELSGGVYNKLVVLHCQNLVLLAL